MVPLTVTDTENGGQRIPAKGHEQARDDNKPPGPLPPRLAP